MVPRSELSTESYHSFSDATMDTLLESLEELLDELGNPSYEVEYHVRACLSIPQKIGRLILPLRRAVY